LIEILADVLGKEPEDQITVLLKQRILATVSTVGVSVT
jgi:hypothetical protein